MARTRGHAKAPSATNPDPTMAVVRIPAADHRVVPWRPTSTLDIAIQLLRIPYLSLTKPKSTVHAPCITALGAWFGVQLILIGACSALRPKM